MNITGRRENPLYNIFNMKNILNDTKLNSLSEIFKVLAAPARLRILLAIGEGEACVCHLEAVLGWRQAYISQQLMRMREAGLLLARREGRFVYYRLRHKGWLEIIRQAAEVLQLPELNFSAALPEGQCACPACRRG